MQNNIILLTDSYKISHYKQLPPKSETVYSYFESRGGDYSKTRFFGLQYFLKEYLSKGFSLSDIEEAQYYYDKHLGPGIFNREGWLRMYEKHKGNLPVSIKAVPEGRLVDGHNVLMSIENTDKEFPWLTNYLETLLVEVWYPTTVATQSYYIKLVIQEYLEKTGNPELINFKLHDFGFRGVSSPESAGLGGLAHLVNFMGTDTVQALKFGDEYYHCDCAGFSIPASEHSTITSWGRENEAKAMENMLQQYPTGLIACVSDSYDIYNACDNIWGDQLAEQVKNRKGTLVVRPDSGDPVEVIMTILEILAKRFGYTKNKKGYKVLPDFIRIIQGDGVDAVSIEDILRNMERAGWSADNIAFGMGGALLQKLNRDTLKFAFKCSAIEVDGQWKEVYKQPVTDDMKHSKRGRLILIKSPRDAYFTLEQSAGGKDELVEVFRNGNILKEYTLDECRKNI